MKRFYSTLLIIAAIAFSQQSYAQLCSGAQAPYCFSNANSTLDELIVNVTLAGATVTLNNTTHNCSGGGQSSTQCNTYLSLPAPDLTHGNVYTLNVTTG